MLNPDTIQKYARLLAEEKLSYTTQSHAIGGGEWSLEVYDEEGELLFELVGSNGTREPADDLHGVLDNICHEAYKMLDNGL